MKDWKEYDENRLRKNRIVIRVTDDELRIINKKAEASRLNRTKYIIETLINGYVIVQDLESLRNLTNEINKIGVNINQIANNTNTTNNIYKSDMEEMKNQLEQIYKIVEKLL